MTAVRGVAPRCPSIRNPPLGGSPSRYGLHVWNMMVDDDQSSPPSHGSADSVDSWSNRFQSCCPTYAAEETLGLVLGRRACTHPLAFSLTVGLPRASWRLDQDPPWRYVPSSSSGHCEAFHPASSCVRSRFHRLTICTGLRTVCIFCIGITHFRLLLFLSGNQRSTRHPEEREALVDEGAAVERGGCRPGPRRDAGGKAQGEGRGRLGNRRED